MIEIGSIVRHAEQFHVRNNSRGAVEAITEQGWYRVWWQEDADNQITPAFRTYELQELKLWNPRNLPI
jgi:hypothetical protein